jgi:DivIVA domain-containing protein
MDRQAIERRDFPIVRRGYDPASVDAHLRALAAEVEELRRQLNGPARDSIASAAGAQVQGILEAAQASAQAIEAEAAEHSQRVREEAAEQAGSTREQAIATAQERVAAVTAATEALLQRVGDMDGETRTLIESLRGGAGRLVADLEALAAEMGTLYDAAGKRAPAPAATAAEDISAAAATDAGESRTSQNGASVTTPPPSTSTPQPDPAGESQAVSVAAPASAPAPSDPATTGSQDVDGARLVALNMALNGDSREVTGRYLAEHFHVAEPERLLDEVYAAIEG